MNKDLLKAAYRGKRKIKEKSALEQIAGIKDKLAATKLSFPDNADFEFNMELSCRQFVAARCLNRIFTLKLLAAKTGFPVTHPVPPEWAAVLIEEGFSINSRLSNLLWRFFICFLSVRSFFNFLSILCNSLKNRPEIEGKKIICLLGMPEAALKDSGSGDSNFIDWVLKSIKKETILIHNSRPVKSRPLNSFVSLRYEKHVALATSGRKEILYAARDAVSFFLTPSRANKLKLAMISDEIFKYYCTRYSKNRFEKIIATVSELAYRPVWTYGIKSELIFYSLNYMNPISSRINDLWRWRIMSWDFYMSWCEYHRADLIKSGISPNKIQCNRPVLFEGRSLKNQEKNILRKKDFKIAIFDVAPGRASVDLSYTPKFDYYNIKSISLFLSELHRVAMQTDTKIIWKPKRGRGKNGHKQYSFLLQYYQKLGFFLMEDSIAPISILNEVDGVVSIPFTTPAHIANHLGRPVIFFDPTCTVSSNSPGLKGVELAHSRDQLVRWIVSTKKTHKQPC